MATIANLDINLFARTKRFDKPIQKSNKTFKTFVRDSKVGFNTLKTASRVGIAAVAAVGGAAVTAGLAFNRLQTKVADLTKQFKDIERFGLRAGNAFGTFKVLALQTGLEVEKFVDVSKDLSIRIGEANQDGQGEIFDLFKRLNLDVKELIKLQPAEQMTRFADAISKVKNETERLTIADIMLSDAGTDTLKVFEQGAGVFQEAARQADRFGVSISQLDVQKLHIANESFGRIGLFLEGISQQIVSRTAPTFAALADTIFETTDDFKQFGRAGEIAFEGIHNSIGFVGDAWNILIGNMMSGIASAVKQIGRMLAVFAKMEQAAVRAGGQRFNFGLEQAALRANAFAAGLQSGADKQILKGLTGEFSRTFEANFDAAIKRAEKQVKDFGKSFDFKTLKPIEDLNATLKKPGGDDISVGAVTRGSSAAVSAIIQANKKNGTNNELQRNRAEIKNGNKELREIKKRLRGNAVLIPIN